MFFLPAQHCPEIHVDNNVQVNGATEEAAYGNVVRFSCKSGNEILIGSPEVYCDENGEWSGGAPICKGTTEWEKQWGKFLIFCIFISRNLLMKRYIVVLKKKNHKQM